MSKKMAEYTHPFCYNSLCGMVMSQKMPEYTPHKLTDEEWDALKDKKDLTDEEIYNILYTVFED